MFGKKVSEAEYNELEQKYLTFECAYNNEHAKCSDLEKQVKELTDQIKRLKEAGNVLPEDLVKRAENAENQVKELNVLLEAEKSKNSSSEADIQMQDSYKQLYEVAKQGLEIEKSKVAELTAKLQTIIGGNRMDKTEWEYKVIKQNSSDDVTKNEKELQQLGSQNWEVTGVMPQNSSNNNQIILKRPKQPIPEYGYSR